MSWQAWSFVLLAIVLGCGFAWYERSRPSARLVALVAALAALAVAGRLVLAPIPNVVATTDIALITGYALGGAPGFAVGALAAPVSNIWLGQGPWTPWQMAGWGMVGVLGAWLATVSGRRLGRLGLASACAAAGFAYGALLDYSVMAGYGGEQSLDRYLALSARGMPFNVAHAAGNFVFALAAGPALVRMISRYRDRLGFSWRPAGALPVAIAALAIAALPAPAGGSASAADAEAEPQAAAPGKRGAGSARRYLERSINSDGGYGFAPGKGSNVEMTGWAMLGLEAAGRNPLDVRRGGSTPVEYLAANAGRLRSSGDLERTILALDAAGVSPRSFAGRDLVSELRKRRRRDGSWQGQINLTAYGVLALRAAGAERSSLRRSREWLDERQRGDGGWGFQSGQPSDPDTTGAALQAMRELGGGLGDGVGYLRGSQHGAGGWGLQGSGVTNSQSTAWAVQGLVAARTNPESVTKGGRSGIDYLRERQRGGGYYSYSASSSQTPVWVTSQALLAVRRKALPMGTVPRASEPGGLSAPVAQPGGSGAGSPAGAAGESGSGTGGGGGARGAGDGAGAGAHGDEGGGPQREAVSPELAADEEPADGSGRSPVPFIAGGGAALAALLGGGFVWYRRTLP
jgi:energy-coupling factor transport system substrate-specific component